MSSLRRGGAGLLAAVAALSTKVHAQTVSTDTAPALEEIVVTATRVATNLQQTPMSVQTFSTEDLELSGIDNGRDLGIMVPNAVLNASVHGERASRMIIRGLPGVTTYVDGFAAGSWGFLQRSFVEYERIEVLRGPQGTLFGRNSNGGAIQFITKQPAEDFGARLAVEIGEFDRRTLRLSVDVPISDRLKTKWTAASDENDGFLESQTAPFSLGGQDDLLLRADVLWQPTNNFSMRLTAAEQNYRGTDPRIVRITNPDSIYYIAYNVLAGNPDYLDQARTIDPTFPDPPITLASDRFTRESHEPGYPGGTLGQWQTRSDTPGPTTIADTLTTHLTLNWAINDHWSLESLTSYSDADFRQIADYDASEFTFTTFLENNEFAGSSQELHLTGSHFDGRVDTLLGAWYTRWDSWDRGARQGGGALRSDDDRSYGPARSDARLPCDERSEGRWSRLRAGRRIPPVRARPHAPWRHACRRWRAQSGGVSRSRHGILAEGIDRIRAHRQPLSLCKLRRRVHTR
jgi:outer membrane receptor protein involved in Fe transport